MKGRRLFALSVLAIALACDDHSSPTEPSLNAPTGPAWAISDGANGGNPDFFFLPPMVPNPVGNRYYEATKFNATLGPRLTIEICRLAGAPVDPNGNARETRCADNVPLVKKFEAGTVRLQGTAPDAHYQALWNTRESIIDVTLYYRIKVLIAGSPTEPGFELGFADIDPMENKSQVKNPRTGEVIALVDGSTLPIKFRVEQSALCNAGESLCASTVVTNLAPNGVSQIVRITGADGSVIAGVLIPDRFLPETGPQSVVLTIDRVNTGVNDLAAGTQSIPCHANLPLQQFNSCFHFSTIPPLPIIPETGGHQFVKPLKVAVCFVLHDLGDPREPWVQLWSSEEGGEDTKPLPGTSAAQILAGSSGETCGDDLVASTTPSTGFARFASAGWKKMKGGLGQLFGVKTAYAIDLGLGGLAFDLSSIGPALTAYMRPTTSTAFTVRAGTSAAPTVKIEGTKTHSDNPVYNLGIDNLPVRFTLTRVGSEDPPVTQVVSTGEDGQASFNWTPTEAGNYTITARGQAIGTATFTATVTPATIVSAVSSALSLVANSTAEGVLVQDVDGASQTTTLNELSASVNALSVVGTTSVQTQNSAVATWTDAANGRVVFTGLGWTVSGSVGATDNHAVVSNSADWTYTFTATSTGNFTIQYAVTLDAGTTYPFGLNYFSFVLIENGAQVDQQFFTAPDALGTVNQGSVTRTVVAGRTYVVRLGNNANIHFGTFGASGTTTAHMSGTFDWSISPPTIIE